ncbi:hypothetical protein [Amycolatopsis thermoflava]|uniref:hypothetical protein n=1 Tax=Amycolatopsis thermoflava TaxID=84480 RepID=UPI003825A7F2
MPQLSEIRGDHVLQIDYAAQAAGASETPVGVVPFNAKVTRVQWVPGAAVTANGTNYTTLNLRNRAAGVGSAVAASRSYAATNSSAQVPEDLTLSGTASDLLLAKGDVLSIDKTIAGTGLATPAGKVVVYLQAR